MKKIIISFIIVTVIFTVKGKAQIEAISSTVLVLGGDNLERGLEKVDAFGEVISTANESKGTATLVPGFYRTAKPIAADFSGYTIQLTTSSRELTKEDSLYQEFGGVMVEENLSPKFSYLVGQFRTLEGAQKYKDTVISERYSDAVVVKYIDGKRSKKL